MLMILLIDFGKKSDIIKGFDRLVDDYFTKLVNLYPIINHLGIILQRFKISKNLNGKLSPEQTAVAIF